MAAAPSVQPSSLSPAALKQSRAQELVRAERAHVFLGIQAARLGLGSQDALQLERVLTNAQGQAVVRFHQKHQGARVFGSSAVVRVQDDNRSELLVASLRPDIHLTAPATLSAGQAIQASHRELMPQGAYHAQPTAELLVFPTQFATGLKASYDPVKGMSWDREGSILAPRPAEPFVWAYEVTSVLRNDLDGVRDMHVIVDAHTGNVLRKWDAAPAFFPKGKRKVFQRGYGTFDQLKAPFKVEASLPAMKAMRPTAARPTAASGNVVGAEIGLGRGLYNRDVPLATSDNTTMGYGFDLLDITRALNPHYWWDGSNWTGNVTCYFDASQWSYFPYTMDYSAGSTDNTWGDGLTYFAPAPVVDADGNIWAPQDGYHYGDANGQTEAVDAHYAAMETYDMYRDVLGRQGIDGQDTGMMSVVHYRYAFDNAMWDTYDHVMIYGDGTYPLDPQGDRSLTSMDVGAHEMSHGVMGATANMDYQLESGGLNESNSDIFSQAVVAYSKRGATDPVDQIPAVALPWTLGAEINPVLGPLRFFKKPSLDGASQDAWFYGMSMLDVHYTSGPGNRMFYYLCMGAPSDSTAEAYSPYLPAGMNGIGIDHAIRIWYKALTEQFTNTTDYAAAREGALLAARDLYGADSAEYAAVENAFAAINVGAAHGAAPRPRVTFPDDLVASDTPMGQDWTGAFPSTPIIPAGETARLQAKTENASDPTIDWKAGIAKGFFAPNNTRDPLDVTAANGVFDANGLYHAPKNAPVWCGVRAFSRQDPLEFAAGMLFIANLDADGDSEVDAADAATLALTWGLNSAATRAIATYPDPESIGFVDDFSLQMWGEGFKNAFEK
jgi:Zn-dependent metalloprotease